MTAEEWRAGKRRCLACDDTGQICAECGKPDGFCECEDHPRFEACECPARRAVLGRERLTKTKGARRRVDKQDAERALAVAYVNVAVAIAALEHQVEHLVKLIRQTAPPPRKRERTRP